MDWTKYFEGEHKDWRCAYLTWENGELVRIAIRRRRKRKVTVKITDKNRNEPWVLWLCKFTEGL